NQRVGEAHVALGEHHEGSLAHPAVEQRGDLDVGQRHELEVAPVERVREPALITGRRQGHVTDDELPVGLKGRSLHPALDVVALLARSYVAGLSPPSRAEKHRGSESFLFPTWVGNAVEPKPSVSKALRQCRRVKSKQRRRRCINRAKRRYSAQRS